MNRFLLSFWPELDSVTELPAMESEDHSSLILNLIKQIIKAEQDAMRSRGDGPQLGVETYSGASC